MELRNKSDFETCLERVEAWWDCQIVDRPPVTLSVQPKAPGRTIAKHHASLRDRWLDMDYALDCVDAATENGTYLAENFPRYFPNLGPEICATAFSSELTFSEYSSWSHPCLENIRQFLTRQPDLGGTYWQLIRKMTAESLRRGKGKWLTGVTDLHTNGDLLAALRDPQNFALDYADDFEGVQLACKHVMPMFNTFYEDLQEPILRAGDPSCTWGVALSRQKMYYHSCDFICMISPQMFQESILPILEYESRQTQRGIFHLDGPGALKHLDALLGLPMLHAIQWTYGAGQGRASDWIQVYQRVQRAGKAVEIHLQDLDDAKVIMENLRPEGVWMFLFQTLTQEQAKTFLADVQRWAERKK